MDGQLLCMMEPLASSKKYDVHIVDRWKRGFLFCRLDFGLLSEMSTADALEFAVAASALKHTIQGDLIT